MSWRVTTPRWSNLVEVTATEEPMTRLVEVWDPFQDNEHAKYMRGEITGLVVWPSVFHRELEMRITMKTKYWCMGCGTYESFPCDYIGHISRKTSNAKGEKIENGPTTIAATVNGKLCNLRVTLP